MRGRQQRPDNAPDLELRVLLNSRRVALGLSIADIARELDLSTGAVGHWMVGRRVPLLSEVAALARTLGIERTELATLVRAARMHRRGREQTMVPRRREGSATAPEPLGSAAALLSALGDLFSDAVLILDVTGRVTYVNPIAEAFLRSDLRNVDHREAWRRFGFVTDESGLVVSPENSPLAHGLRSDHQAQTHCVIYHQPNGWMSTLCFVVDPVITERRERVGVIVRWRPLVQRHASNAGRQARSDKE